MCLSFAFFSACIGVGGGSSVAFSDKFVHRNQVMLSLFDSPQTIDIDVYIMFYILVRDEKLIPIPQVP